MRSGQQYIEGVTAPLLEDGLPVPPLPARRVPVWEFYHLDFDTDGCPMKRMPDGRLQFHPILPPYLVVDYLDLFAETGDPRCLTFALHVMTLALRRADPDRQEITFTYRQDSGLSSIPKDFYSALTQSWYLRALAKLEEHRPGHYADALRRVFDSFLISVSEGGVLLERPYGWIVEEYPADPPLYTLNGWLTALRHILSALPVLKRCGVECEAFLEKNLQAVDHLLPLYEAEFCSNTRYQLTGFTRLKFVTDRSGSMLENGALEIHIEGEKTVHADLAPQGPRNRWRSYLERSTERLAQFNVVLSLVSHPAPNRYAGLFRVARDCEMSVFLAEGDYRPDLSGLPTTGWREIGRHRLSAGANRIDGEIPFDDRNLFAYPTNFKKKIGGLHYNAYHFIHVIDLAVLYYMTGRENYAETARKWMRYMEAWPTMPELSDPGISHLSYNYGTEFEAVIEQYLASSLERL